MKQNASNRRVNEQARQVIAETLMFEFSDPRLSLLTITGCEVSFDRSVCNVYYTTTPDRYAEAQEALSKASGRLRSLLARKLSWRTSPELRFFIDKSVDEAERIAIALERERSRNAGAPDGDGGDGGNGEPGEPDESTEPGDTVEPAADGEGE